MKEHAGGIVAYAKQHYPMVAISVIEGVQTTITGTVHDVLSLQRQYNSHLARGLHSNSLHPNTSSCSSGVAAVSDTTTSNRKEYPNLNPDVLALLEKLPEGKIPGVHYDTKRGCIVLDDCSTEKESVCISSFQEKYRELTSSHRMKVDAVEIPEKLSKQDVKEMISTLDAKYSQCVFVIEENSKAVRVISNSSRQFEQAKKILRDTLKQASHKEVVGSTSWTPSECMTIPIAGGRKLMLKRANIVLEKVDIIVNAANGNLDHAAGVAGAINRASNGAVQKLSKKFVDKHGKLSTGQVAVTAAGGSLKCKHIIHAVGPIRSEHSIHTCELQLRELTKRVLEEAENKNANSISIPAISAGIYSVGADLVAKSIIESILAFKFKKSLPILSDIRIVIIDQATHRSFAQFFASRMPDFVSAEVAPVATRERSNKPSSSLPVTTSASLPSTSSVLSSTNNSQPSTMTDEVLPFSESVPPSTSTVPSSLPSTMANVPPSMHGVAAPSSSTNTVPSSWPSIYTVTPALPPTVTADVSPPLSSSTTVPDSSLSTYIATPSTSTNLGTVSIVPSTSTTSPKTSHSLSSTNTVGLVASSPIMSSAPTSMDGAPLSLPASNSEFLSTTGGSAPLSLPAIDSVASNLPSVGTKGISDERSGIGAEGINHVLLYCRLQGVGLASLTLLLVQ